MWEYAVHSLAWSAVGFFAGAGLTQLGWDIRTIVRHSGRRHHDDT